MNPLPTPAPIANSTANPNANYFQPGQGGNPNPPSQTINGSTLGQSTAMKLTTPTQTPIPSIATLGQTPTTPAPTPAAPTASVSQSTLDKLQNLFSSSQNKASDLATTTAAATAPYQSQLNELNQQIKMQQAQAIENADNATNRVGGTTGSNSIATQQQQRTDSIEAMKLSALAQGMQGNISLAQQQASMAIDAKYADITSQLQDAKTNIMNNYDSFSPAEKKQADQTLLRLDANDAFAKQNIENEKTSAGIIQTAITQSATNGNPVPNVILQQAQKLTDPTQVTALLAPYLKNAADIQKAIDAHNQSVASTASSNATTAKTRLETSILNTSNNPNSTVPISNQNGTTTSVPVSVAPYANMSHSGVAYADLSTVQGTAAQKTAIVNAAQAAGMKVITNKNTATDIFNIGDANNKLDTVLSTLSNIDQPSALSRDLGGLGLSYFATMAQSDPQKAAAGVLSSIGTDILKAMQGVQGSRMSQAAVANINKELPTIYDTQATAQAKVDNLKALLSDREDAILGAKGTSATGTVSVQGKNYSVGQVYQDNSGSKWTVDSKGKWTKQ